MRASRRKALLAFLYLAAFLMMLVLYANYLAPTWGYQGFEYQFNGARVALAIVLILAFVAVTPGTFSVRGFYLNLALCICLLPSLILYALGDEPTSSAAVVWVAIAIVYLISAAPLRAVRVAELSVDAVLWLVLIATFALLASIYRLVGLAYFNLDLSMVYAFRRDAAAALPPVFGYLVPVFGNMLIPLGIAFAIAHRRLLATALLVAASVLMFGLTAHRGMLFYPIIVIGTYFVFSRFPANALMPTVFVILLLAVFVEPSLTAALGNDSGGNWYGYLFFGRTVMTPALLDYQYMDFFAGHDLYYWSSSRITFGLFHSTYSDPAPQMIGQVYFGSDDISANTGFVGSGYSQAGWTGVVVYALGVGLVIAALRAYSRRSPLALIIAVSIIPMSSILTSSDLLVALFSEGFLLLFLLLALVRLGKPGYGAGPASSASTGFSRASVHGSDRVWN